ncbi:MAG TPA: bifunctional UDP-sugar hydrolase/5'-nucleotidase [Thermoanaerobaculia bacterium]|nr:bifunctional UDP-sugar hydrolase/5'-nucleotidase [Thermoanaerobaculia bacterium]
MRRTTLLALLILIACTTSTTSRAPEGHSEAPLHLVIVSTTDLHGWVDGHDETVEGSQKTVNVHWGGLEVLAGYLDNIREANPGRVLLLDQGDLFQGTLVSNLSEGEVVVKAYNQLGYVASAVGNHEFDFGPVGPHSVVRQPGEDPLGALKRNVKMARFKFLAANIFEKDTKKHPWWVLPYMITEVAGARIGIIGISTPDTPVVTAPANVISLDFTDPTAAVVEAARDLRSQGVDAVILLAHIGGGCRDNSDPHDASTCEIDADSFRLARSLPPGTVDVFLSGHTHKEARQFVNGIPVMEPAALGRGFGVVDLYVDLGRHSVRSEQTTMRPLHMVCGSVFSSVERCDSRVHKDADLTMKPAIFEGKPVQPSPAMRSLLNPYIAAVAAKRAEKLGIVLGGPFIRDYTHESALGDLVADALVKAHPESDFGVVNSGGLRSDLINRDVTYGDVFEVLPFDNYVATVRMTGGELRRFMTFGTAGRQGIFQVSGLKMVVDGSATNGERLRSITRSDGTPLDDDQMYTVVTSDFIAAGGDGVLPVTSQLPPDRIYVYYDPPTMRDVVIEALKKMSASGTLVPRTEHRIDILNEREAN